MSHKLAEKLLVLNDVGQGLLARIHSLVSFGKPQVLKDDPLIDKYAKLLIKKFPEFPDVSKGVPPGHDLYKSRSTEICTALKDYYLTFTDVLNFNDESLKVLKEGADNLTGLQFDINGDLMNLFFQLLISFIQLQIMTSRVEDRRFLVACYAKAFHFTDGNTEPNYQTIATYFTVYEKPIRKLQDDLVFLSDVVGDALLTLFKPLQEWSQVSNLVQHRVFNILEEPLSMTLPKGEMHHLSIVQVAEFRIWVLWGLLVCPAALQKPLALDLLCLALKNVFVLCVFRDEVLGIHEEFRTLFEWWKSPTNKKFKLADKACKKYLKEAREDWQGTLQRHADLRTYLRVEMDTLYHFFLEFPTVLAPKLQMVYTVVHMARDEIVWYFRHARPDVVPFKLKAAKYTFLVDPDISTLIHLTIQLLDFVHNYKGVIEQYYQEYLQGPDLDIARPVVDQFVQNTPKLNMSQKGFIDSIVNALSSPDVASKLQLVRMNWYRLSSSISHRASDIQFKSTEQFSKVMAHLIHHSRNVDVIETQIKAHGSLKHLYYYREDLEKYLETSLVGDNGQPAHCLSLVKVFDRALDNVHRICPEEYSVVTNESIKEANHFMRVITHKGIGPMINTLTKASTYLRWHTSEDRIVEHLEKGKPIPKPPNLDSVGVVRRAVGQICSACRITDSFFVGHVEFYPREYLYEHLSTMLRTQLRHLIYIPSKCVRAGVSSGQSVGAPVPGTDQPQPGTSGKQDISPMDIFTTDALGLDYYIERPSVVLAKFKDILYSFQEIEKHIDINVSDIVREVMLREFYEESAGMCGENLFRTQAVDEKEEENREKTSIYFIAKWYTALFSQDLGGEEMGITYSRTNKTFLSRAVPLKGQAARVWIDASYYTDVKELNALCTLIGPYGVRVLDRALLGIIGDKAKQIKDVMTRHQTTLSALENQFTERPLWIESKNKLTSMSKAGPQISDLDMLTLHASVAGAALIFRRLLHDGLAEVCKQHANGVYEAVKLTVDHVTTKMPPETDFSALMYLAEDCGIDTKDLSQGLVDVLQKFKASSNDRILWDLLPEAFGMSYLSTRWRAAKYRIHDDGHDNNCHAMVECVHSFISVFQRLSLKAEVLQQLDAEKRTQAMLARFVRCSATSLLHMHQLSKDKSPKEKEETVEVISHCMIFLEQFILGTRGRLTLSFLEECFPYTLLRVNYIKLYTAEDKAAFADVDEELPQQDGPKEDKNEDDDKEAKEEEK